MRRLQWVLLLITSLLIVATVALIFGEAQKPTTGTKTDVGTSSGFAVEASKYPLKLTMAIDRTELDLGETLYVNLTVENIGDRDLTMYFADGCDEFWFVIYNESDGSRAYTHLVGYPQEHVPQVMHPHETVVKNWEWSQVGDLVYVGLDKNPPYYYKTIVPGKYSIAGTFKSDTLDSFIQTPLLSFTIRG